MNAKSRKKRLERNMKAIHFAQQSSSKRPNKEQTECEWLIRYASNVCPCHSPSATSTSTSCGGMLSALRTAKSISRCATLHVDGKYCDNVTGQKHRQTTMCVHMHTCRAISHLAKWTERTLVGTTNTALCCAVLCPRRIAGHLRKKNAVTSHLYYGRNYGTLPH